MRVGLLSDVHGNLTALEAVAAALDREAAREGALDRVVVLGDLLLGGPRPREVWGLLRRRGWDLVRGNEDEVLLHDRPVPGPVDTRFGRAYAAQRVWTRQRAGATLLAALAALPAAVAIDTPAGRLLAVHASPRGVDDRHGGVDNSVAEIAAAYGASEAAAFAFGHFHRNFVRPTPYGLLINVASVGLPFDRVPLAAYTIVHAREDGWLVEQRHVAYDAQAEAQAAEREDLPPWAPDEGLLPPTGAGAGPAAAR